MLPKPELSVIVIVRDDIPDDIPISTILCPGGSHAASFFSDLRKKWAAVPGIPITEEGPDYFKVTLCGLQYTVWTRPLEVPDAFVFPPQP